MESTLAGYACCLFSETKAAAVTCAIIRPEFDSRLGCQERRQARQSRIHQQRDAPLRQRSDLTDRQRQDIGREGDRFGVKIAAGQNIAELGDDQRIVRHAVCLGDQRHRHLPHQIECRAHDLRLATHRVWILNAGIACEMRRADLASGHQRAQCRRHVDLSTMTAQGVDARVEWRVGSARRIGRKRAADQCTLEHALGGEQRQQGVRG